MCPQKKKLSELHLNAFFKVAGDNFHTYQLWKWLDSGYASCAQCGSMWMELFGPDTEVTVEEKQ